MSAKRSLSDLAIFGGPRLFPELLPVGQIYPPDWERFRELTGGVFSGRNLGLARKLEDELAELLRARNVVAVTNATVGLALAAVSLGLKGKVILPSFTFAATAQAMSWVGLEPVFCDINPQTHAIDAERVLPSLKKYDVAAILGVHLWGNACAIEEVEAAAKAYGAKVFYDAAHALGCTHGGTPIGNFGACEVFSFHATKVLNAAEGGCVVTNDDALAKLIREMSSPYGRRVNPLLPLVADARFSEFQAAFGLLSLENLAKNCEINREKLETYRDKLADTPGLKLMSPARGEKHNYQYVTFEVDKAEFGLSRDRLTRVLAAENIGARRYFVPGLHKSPPYNEQTVVLPHTEALCEKVFQFPSGAKAGLREVEKICALTRFIHENAANINRKLEARAT